MTSVANEQTEVTTATPAEVAVADVTDTTDTTHTTHTTDTNCAAAAAKQDTTNTDATTSTTTATSTTKGEEYNYICCKCLDANPRDRIAQLSPCGCILCHVCMIDFVLSALQQQQQQQQIIIQTKTNQDKVGGGDVNGDNDDDDKKNGDDNAEAATAAAAENTCVWCRSKVDLVHGDPHRVRKAATEAAAAAMVAPGMRIRTAAKTATATNTATTSAAAASSLLEINTTLAAKKTGTKGTAKATTSIANNEITTNRKRKQNMHPNDGSQNKLDAENNPKSDNHHHNNNNNHDKMDNPQSSSTMTMRQQTDSRKRHLSFEERFQQLVWFKAKHGHLRIPKSADFCPKQSPGMAEDTPRGLSDWMRYIRKGPKRDCLTDAQKLKLDQIGFIWESKRLADNRDWWKRLEQLKTTFANEAGHANIPFSHPNKVLVEWIHTQRRLYKRGKLKKDRQAALEEIGLAWNRKDAVAARLAAASAASNGAAAETGAVYHPQEHEEEEEEDDHDDPDDDGHDNNDEDDTPASSRMTASAKRQKTTKKRAPKKMSRAALPIRKQKPKRQQQQQQQQQSQQHQQLGHANYYNDNAGPLQQLTFESTIPNNITTLAREIVAAPSLAPYTPAMHILHPQHHHHHMLRATTTTTTTTTTNHPPMAAAGGGPGTSTTTFHFLPQLQTQPPPAHHRHPSQQQQHHIHYRTDHYDG